MQGDPLLPALRGRPAPAGNPRGLREGVEKGVGIGGWEGGRKWWSSPKLRRESASEDVQSARLSRKGRKNPKPRLLQFPLQVDVVFVNIIPFTNPFLLLYQESSK